MKLRMTETGWTDFTGNFGGVDFEDGLSARALSPIEVDRLSALIRMEAEDGTEVGASHRIVGGAALQAPVLEGMAVQTDEEKAAELAATAPAPAPVVTVFHTAEELEAIASDKGLKGLREIAGPLGVKGRSINELIEEILKAESEIKASQPAPAEEAPAADADAPVADADAPADAPVADATETPEA